MRLELLDSLSALLPRVVLIQRPNDLRVNHAKVEPLLFNNFLLFLSRWWYLLCTDHQGLVLLTSIDRNGRLARLFGRLKCFRVRDRILSYRCWLCLLNLSGLLGSRRWQSSWADNFVADYWQVSQLLISLLLWLLGSQRSLRNEVALFLLGCIWWDLALIQSLLNLWLNATASLWLIWNVLGLQGFTVCCHINLFGLLYVLDCRSCLTWKNRSVSGWGSWLCWLLLLALWIFALYRLLN